MKNLWIIIVVFAISITNVIGNEIVQDSCKISQRLIDCEATLDACDAAVTNCNEVIVNQNYYLQVQREALEQAEKRAKELENQRDSLWRNPLVWATIGVFIGATAAVLAGKAF